jgi:superfamily II DNA/RNA helicase
VTTSFADLGVPAHIVASLDARGITEPFPIQVLTLPDGLAGRDVSGRAPTGSGKTLAFGIPLVVDCDRARPKRPRRLVLVPTRELATQVASELRMLAGPDGPRVEAIFGGVPISRQATALRSGVDIVVACPGRLADLINQKLIRLDGIDVVVLDEADRMADMGFLPEVKRLLDQCPDDRRTILFSATLDGDVDVLVKRYQHDPVRHELHVPEEDAPDVDHHFWEVDKTQRVATAAQVVDRLGPTVVFCRTKRGADRITRQLGAAGIGAVAIHGDRSQGQRDRALQQFREGRASALVATDVAARGIHVDDVAAVIHFDPPAEHKDYVHRSGRTARAGRRGVVVSLVSPDLRSDVATLQRRLGLPTGLDRVDLEALGEARLSSPSAPSNRRTRTEAKREQDGPTGGTDTRERRDEDRRPRGSKPPKNRNRRGRNGSGSSGGNTAGGSGRNAGGSSAGSSKGSGRSSSTGRSSNGTSAGNGSARPGSGPRRPGGGPARPSSRGPKARPGRS